MHNDGQVGTRGRLGRVLRLMQRRPLRLAVAIILVAVCAAFSRAQQPGPDSDEVLTPVMTKGDLYPANADAKTEIDEALKKARKAKKRVMLIFGANWCYDCHVLDRALHEGDAGQIVQARFVLVHVDIGEGDKNLDLVKKYKTPLDKGVPAVAILRSDGELLYSSAGGEFESARRMMKKDLVAFLNRWKDSWH
jgi:thiol:disulfide interchange protein